MDHGNIRTMILWMRWMYEFCVVKSMPPHFVVNVMRTLVRNVLTHTQRTKLFIYPHKFFA